MTARRIATWCAAEAAGIVLAFVVWDTVERRRLAQRRAQARARRAQQLVVELTGGAR